MSIHTIVIRADSSGLTVRSGHDDTEELVKLYMGDDGTVSASFNGTELWERFLSLDETIDFIVEVFNVKCCVTYDG